MNNNQNNEPATQSQTGGISVGTDVRLSPDEVIEKFARNILENTEGVPPEIAKICSEHFWEMYERF